MPLHVWDNGDNNIRVIPINIADGVTGTAIRTYTVTGLNDVQSLVFDGTHLHATRWNDETVHVFLPSTANGQAAAVVRTYEVSGIRQPGAMAFDGTNIHIGDREDDNFRVIAPDTANGETATLIREYTVPGVGDTRGMTFDGTNLHIGDYTDDNFRVIAVPTTGGAQTVLRTYTVAGVAANRAMAFDGTQLHVTDITDDNFRVIAIPTAGGAQTILRTYTITGVNNPRGLELVPNTAPVFDQASYSFGSVAIAVNTVVGSVTATDADNDPLSYSLTGTDASNFAIASNGEITVAVELAESTTYNFNVVVNDGTVDATMPVTVESITTGPPTDATFTITGPTADIYAGQTVDFTIESNIDITDFTFDDVVLTGATFVSFTLTSENTWRYRVTADAGAGVIAMIIREDTVSPGNNAASQTFVRNANPTVAMTTTDTDIRVGHIFTVVMQWSSNVTGFANADVTVTGATKISFAVSSASRYVLALRANQTPGDIVVTIRENAVDQRNAETVETFVNNDLATVTMTPRETSIRGGQSTVVDITFTEDVTNFRESDLSVDVGTLSGFTGSDDTYEVTVTAPATGAGNITLTLPRAVTQPENHAATAMIAYQPPPTVAITFGTTRLGVGEATTVTMVWSEAPTGFDATDVTADAGTLTGFAGSGITYTATLTAPSSGDGTITITIPAGSIDEGNAVTTARINYVDARVPPLAQLGFESFNVGVELEIEGVDVTRDMLPNQPLQYYESLDFPNFGTFEARGVQLLLDNRSGRFDTGATSNFWTDNSLPASGAGAKVLLTVTKGMDTFQFAGQVELVRQELSRRVATLVVRDLSLLLRFAVPSDFGQELTRTITDFDGATENYSEDVYRFDFPKGYFPIAEGSLSVVRVDGTDRHDVTVVEGMVMSGVPQADRAFVDYAAGYIRFEAEPADGDDTVIEATWKIDYRYRTPSALLTELMKSAGVRDTLGLTDDAQLRYAIDSPRITRTAESFTSHGRPYLQENGVVRWMRRNGDTWQMIQDQRFVEYDAEADEYDEVTELPEEDIDGTDLSNYGQYLADESFDVDAIVDSGIAVDVSRIYALDSNNSRAILSYLLDGTQSTTTTLNGDADLALAVDDTYFYTYAFVNSQHSIRRFSRTDGMEDTNFRFGTTGIQALTIALTPTRILFAETGNVRIFDYSGNRQTSEETTFTAAIQARGLGGNFRAFATNDTHIFVQYNSNSGRDVRAFTHAYVYDSDLDMTLRSELSVSNDPGLAASNTRLYTLNETETQHTIDVYALGEAVSFGAYVPYQFATHDNDTFYFLAANNTQGNAVSASTLRRIKVYRYVKSTNTWTDLLNATTGQPQLSHAYKINGTNYFLANNRKNFQAIEHSNETLVFYRRVQATASGIAYFNDADDSVNDVNTFAHVGADDFNYPYSMDFVLDQRSDGVYVYTFVVRVTFDSGNYDGGWLRIYRERVEPAQAETQIYTETFTASVDEEDYPVSVSDLILDDDRDKFYFTLEYHNEGDGAGKAELCTIAKDGTGSRTIIKTYDNPLLSARSPVIRDGSPYYLEGGWVRQPAAMDEANDLHDYPNEGGRLIEINASDAVEDHGVVWRDGTKADSPDPDADGEAYAGWGLFNAVISNMVVDTRDNLHFVAGYGTPYNVDENLPFSSNREPVPSLGNFHRLQWGDDLAAKVAAFPTAGQTYWSLAERLAELVGWDVGFGPAADVVAALQSAHPSVGDWSANALPFFRDPSAATTAVATLQDTDASLIDITEKHLDIVNLYNVVRLAYTGGIQEGSDTTSIDMHGRFQLEIANPFLTGFDSEWTDHLISLYLNRFATTKELLTVIIPLNPVIEIGDLVALTTTGGVVFSAADFRVLQRTHDFLEYRTTLLLRQA